LLRYSYYRIGISGKGVLVVNCEPAAGKIARIDDGKACRAQSIKQSGSSQSCRSEFLTCMMSASAGWYPDHGPVRHDYLRFVPAIFLPSPPFSFC